MFTLATESFGWSQGIMLFMVLLQFVHGGLTAFLFHQVKKSDRLQERLDGEIDKRVDEKYASVIARIDRQEADLKERMVIGEQVMAELREADTRGRLELVKAMESLRDTIRREHLTRDEVRERQVETHERINRLETQIQELSKQLSESIKGNAA